MENREKKVCRVDQSNIIEMKNWLNSLLLLIIICCSAAYCGPHPRQNMHNLEIMINPNPIPVTDGKISFEFKAIIPPNKLNPSLDSISFNFYIKAIDDKTIIIAKSTLILNDSIPWKSSIVHSD